MLPCRNIVTWKRSVVCLGKVMFSKLFQRKKKFVSGPIQGRLMLRMGVYWVLYHVILWHAMFIFRYVEFRLEASSTGLHMPIGQMYNEFLLDYYPIIFCAIIALPIVLVDLMNLSHRIAGPLVRFEHALKDLMAGKDVRKVSLRKGDLLVEFQAEFNKYLDWLHEQGHATVKDADHMTPEEEQLLDDVEQLRRNVQSAIAEVTCPPQEQFSCEDDTVISSTMPRP